MPEGTAAAARTAVTPTSTSTSTSTGVTTGRIKCDANTSRRALAAAESEPDIRLRSKAWRHRVCRERVDHLALALSLCSAETQSMGMGEYQLVPTLHACCASDTVTVLALLRLGISSVWRRQHPVAPRGHFAFILSLHQENSQTRRHPTSQAPCTDPDGDPCRATTHSSHRSNKPSFL